KKFYRVSITIFLLSFVLSLANAGNLGITIGNLYGGLKYKFHPKVSTELRGLFDTGIQTYVIRADYSIATILGRLTPYVGVDFGYILFDIENIKGDGNMYSIFVGNRIRLIKTLMLEIDIGYSNITLQSKGKSVSGPEMMLSTGLVYFIK
ncbi:MAG: hypothetical protein NZ839_04770, partial [Endomicrobia bacterium]|nr:hypothetical protein [Endomicrobiia bacterium]